MTWRHEHQRGGRIFSGILFLIIGLTMLAANLGYIALREFVMHWWPLILIGFGVKHLFLWRGTTAWAGGIFWIGTGLLFLASTLGYLNVGVTGMIWPVMLIWFGVLLAWGPQGRCGDGFPRTEINREN